MKGPGESGLPELGGSLPPYRCLQLGHCGSGHEGESTPQPSRCELIINWLYFCTSHVGKSGMLSTLRLGRWHHRVIPLILGIPLRLLLSLSFTVSLWPANFAWEPARCPCASASSTWPRADPPLASSVSRQPSSRFPLICTSLALPSIEFSFLLFRQGPCHSRHSPDSRRQCCWELSLFVLARGEAGGEGEVAPLEE